METKIPTAGKQRATKWFAKPERFLSESESALVALYLVVVRRIPQRVEWRANSMQAKEVVDGRFNCRQALSVGTRH